MEYLSERDIHHDLVVIKINRTYYDGMSAEALYDFTRGIWKRKIESVSVADYALSVVYGIVVEVYKIDHWMPASDTKFTARKVDPKKAAERIAFVGRVAEETVRKRYIGKSVANLYKYGDANPVRVFLK
ncbi:MAG: hypothetical protein IKE94_01715 [Aeriscardovia sp.]|nr:hypothetical protein [Aeriscardovia sp.]